MKYISTRGKAPKLGFEDVLLTGLASDGGLYVPDKLPFYSPKQIASWAGLSYQQLAYKLIKPFVGSSIPARDLEAIIGKSYGSFRHEAVTPLVQVGHNEWILELFHGPTLAFKDVALQLLGHLLDYVLDRRNERVVIMGATSGDTGSAAIEGCRRCKNIDIFILHPNKRVSEVQRRQMTTAIGKNIFNLAVEGNFDDCQQMVKDCFADQSFLKGKRLVAVNSINWARIMAQIVYYFYAAIHLGAPHRAVSFSVPTGNFGDIFAGYLAKKMGLPVDRLVIATNRNDILHRFLSQNQYQKTRLAHTLSPSMDIMVSSNFERMLFDLYENNGMAINTLMQDFQKNNGLSVPAKRLAGARQIFDSYAVNDKLTCETIKAVFEKSEYLLDPHTAIGVKAGRECRGRLSTPMVTLATAHPAKFPEAIQKAGVKQNPDLPYHMRDLFKRKEKYDVIENDLKQVQAYVSKRI
ncbi:MAG: threonine synthase [Pseudomonadales bacterium]|nr:threonine synthase [Pseudomonadales bacterium]